MASTSIDVRSAENRVGIACRLIVDLGLHNVCTGDTHRARNDGVEGGSPSSIALGCLVYETLWSLLLGRPCHIALSHLSVPPSAAGVATGPTLRAWLELSLPISEITLILNGPVTMKSSTIDRLSEVDEHLRRWYASLPADIALDDNNISALDAVTHGLHMQYLRVQMLLHSLPELNYKRRKQSDCPYQPPVPHKWTAEASRQLVHYNAVKIARLGDTYRQIFGVVNTASVMLDTLYIAAATLISSVLEAKGSTVDQNDIRRLRILDNIMKDLQVHFRITARMRSTLARIVKRCPLPTDIVTDDERTFPANTSANDNSQGTSYCAWGFLRGCRGRLLCLIPTSVLSTSACWMTMEDDGNGIRLDFACMR